MLIMSAAKAPTRPMTTMLSCIMLGLLSTSSMAWSPSIMRAPSHTIMHQFREASAKHYSPRCQTQLSSTKLSTTSSPELSTAYDKNLPAALVGEAVRSALRSDRGICFDFSTDRYHQQADTNEVSPESSRLVSVVKMRGVGTKPFLNAKFSQSISNTIGSGGVQQLSPKTKLVRKGRAFETAYLTSKGRTIDRLLVLEFPPSDNDDNDEKMDDAFLITSPGNSGATLYNELSPLVFPMDKVTLDQCGPSSQTMSSRVITLACSSLKDAQTSFRKNVLKLLMRDESYSQEFGFPEDGVCHHYSVSGSGSGTMADVYVMQHTFLAPEICHGYSLFFHESAENSNTATLGDQIWDNLTDENNNEGPVGMGSLEYDTLRVEAGLPGYGNEMTGDGPKKKKSLKNDTSEKNAEQDESVKTDKYYAKSNPLELHLQSLIDTDKGCYQGQEGIASMLKNKRGAPRQLYQAVFYDSENDFDGDGGGGFGLLSIDNKELMDFKRLTKQADALSNDTRQPCPGDDIYVLGSNESINVGKITSVAEPNGTGDAKTVALALAKRPGNILKAIKDQGLDLPRWWDDVDPGDDDEEDSNGNIGQRIASEKGGSGIMQPPPLDPLHNLEIVVGGTYTVGRLISVPSRRFGFKSRGSGSVASLVDYEKQGGVVQVEDGPAYFKYDFEGKVEDADAEITANLPLVEPDWQLSSEVEEEGDGDDDELDDLLAKAEEEAVKAAAEADAAAAEAKRKEEKMNLLKAKAAAAMAARRKKKESS